VTPFYRLSQTSAEGSGLPVRDVQTFYFQPYIEIVLGNQTSVLY